MGEFDLSLISEFRIHPSFYDRNSPRFRDKLYNAHLWQEISNKLGFDVSILKDRILQLRNRYNLEKRRIEQLKEENPNKVYDSPWPLYEHLHFLSDHIRARRSYRKMLPLNGSGSRAVGSFAAGPELSNSCSNNSNLTLRHVSGSGQAAGDIEGNSQNVTEFPNELLAVKMENVSEETEQETESQNNDSEINAFDTSGLIPGKHSSPLPLQYLQQQQEQHSKLKQHKQHKQQQQQYQLHPNISIRRLDSLRQRFADSPSFNKKLQNQQQRANTSLQNDDSAISAPCAKRPCLTVREFKYTAFGNFVSSSLFDLPTNLALELIEKFTSDIVKVLKEKAQQEEERQRQQQLNNLDN